MIKIGFRKLGNLGKTIFMLNVFLNIRNNSSIPLVKGLCVPFTFQGTTKLHTNECYWKAKIWYSTLFLFWNEHKSSQVSKLDQETTKRQPQGNFNFTYKHKSETQGRTSGRSPAWPEGYGRTLHRVSLLPH